MMVFVFRSLTFMAEFEVPTSIIMVSTLLKELKVLGNFRHTIATQQPIVTFR